MNEDKFLTASIEDKMDQCEERYMVTSTSFLDLRQRSLAEKLLRNGCPVKPVFWGGYSEAERTALIFMPEYVSVNMDAGDIFEESPEDNPLAVVRVKRSPKSRELNHRDYLGSLMGLGIKRECIGDILVRNDGADIIVLREICEFLLMNYGKAGNTYLDIEKVDFEGLMVPEIKLKEKSDTVASMRLDNIISSAYGISRTSAVNFIKGGAVFVNSLQVEKIDYQVKEGDKLVLRGKGKAVVLEIGGKSRKDRIYVKTGLYI